MTGSTINYMGHHWIEIQGDEITVGINDEAVAEFENIQKVILPEQGEEFETDDICGEIETSEGPLNLYVPVNGSISEINMAVMDDPSLIIDDPTGEGWLFKVDASDSTEVAELQGSSLDN